MINENKTRIVGVWATDLASGDDVIKEDGQPIGTVLEPPEVDWAAGKVSVELRVDGGYAIRYWPIHKRVCLEVRR